MSYRLNAPAAPEGMGFIPLVIAAVAGGTAAVATRDRQVVTRFVGSPSCKRLEVSKQYIGRYQCDGGVVDTGSCQEGPCPPQTYSNGTWKAIIGSPNGGYWQWWNERRIRENLGRWTRPGMRWRYLLDATASAYGVPYNRMLITGELLARAFKTFEGMFPLVRWQLSTGVILRLGTKVAFAPNPDPKNNVRNSSTPPAYDMAFHYWSPAAAGWQNATPKVKADLEEAIRFLGLKNEAEVKAWYDKAHALVNRVPGSEDKYNVKFIWNMIAFEPKKMFVHGWVMEFLEVFAQHKPFKGSEPAKKAIAAALAKKK
jgi:hypothetical protein